MLTLAGLTIKNIFNYNMNIFLNIVIATNYQFFFFFESLGCQDLFEPLASYTMKNH